MKAEEIAQWVINNRYPKSENNKISDVEMYHKILDEICSISQFQLKGFKYCPHCGSELEHKVITDINTDKVCENALCKYSRPRCFY